MLIHIIDVITRKVCIHIINGVFISNVAQKTIGLAKMFVRFLP